MMFPFGSGERPQNPTAPPAQYVQSNSSYPGAPRQIQVPFGAGIGFNQQLLATTINSPYPPAPSIGFQPQLSHSQNFPPNPIRVTNSFNRPFPPQAYRTVYPSNAYYQPQNSNVYPNLSHSAPFSYTSPNQIVAQSTGGYKRKGTPTVLPSEAFDPQADAAALRKAMKGFGCDEKTLVDVICRRSNQQRQEIAKVFKTNFGKDLIENIKSETRGNFENLLVALLTPTLDFYCKEIKDAIDCIGTDEDVLIEILSTLSNYEINTIKNHYQKLYGKDLESAIIGDTSGNFKRLLVSLCTANRDESGNTDQDAAKADATSLLRAGELRFGTDESVFNSVLCQRNYNQLKLIFKEYETMTGHSFEQAIKNEFSGDVMDGFLAIFRCVNNKAEFFAHQLQKSMKGLGTNDRQLIRLVVTRCEIDMTEIKEAFERLFGESLKACIRGDTSGDYKHGLYALIGENRGS